MGLPQCSEEVKSLLRLFYNYSRVHRPFKILTDVDPQKFKTRHPLHLLAPYLQWPELLSMSPEISDDLLSLFSVQREIVVSTQLRKSVHHLSIGDLVPI